MVTARRHSYKSPPTIQYTPHGRVLTPDGLRIICAGLDNDPEKIGIHIDAIAYLPKKKETVRKIGF